MNIDVKTGLPELPEGYYWEIREIKYRCYYPYEYTLYPLKVSICTDHKRWFGTQTVRAASSTLMEIGGELPAFYTVKPTTENILRYAEKTLKQFEDSRNRQSAIGVYPPKKLKGHKKC